MKNSIILFLLALLAHRSSAQVGVGTVSPNSTLDIRGSFSVSYRAFTTSTSASSNDHTLVFTGTTASSVTLPDATACAGRIYMIKNASTAGAPPIVTINTSSSQTIDGLSSWLLDQSNESVVLVSNGANWNVAAQTAAGSGTGWALGGNNITTVAQNFGTISNKDLPFITSNTENMRLTNNGNLGVTTLGATAFNGPNPEKLLVHAGTTSSVNAIVGKGSINNYLQLNIQNLSTGANASSDVVATADNGNETTNYVDLGINGSLNSSNVMGNANDAYLYNIGQNFLIGTGATSKALIFLTGGTTQSANERMRIDGSGNVGIGTNSPSYLLHVTASANPLFLGGVQTGLNTDSVLTIINGVVRKLSPTALPAPSNAWALGGNSVASVQNLGTTSNFDFPFVTNNTERMRISKAGNIGIGSSTFNATNPEKLLVQAGTTTSFNLMQGHGKINNYLQLNVQNDSAGTASSSDVVATADNGNETSNYVDMGINSSGNTQGIMGGANDAYLYSTGNNFLIGNATVSKALVFMTGGTAQSTNERMRITGSGSIGIANTNPLATLDVNGTVKVGTTGTILNSIIRFTNQSVTDNVAITYNQTRTETFTLTGVAQYASVIVTPRSALPAGLGIAYAYASATNTVTVNITNATGSVLALGTMAFDITIIQ